MTSTDVNTKVECTEPLIKSLEDMQWRQLGNTVVFGTPRDRYNPNRRITSLAISGDGNRVVWATPSVYGTSKWDKGKALVFDFDGTSWREVECFTPWDIISLSEDGKTLATGAFGGVKIYQYNEEKRWKTVGNIFKSVEELTSVSLSGNGSRIAIEGFFDGPRVNKWRYFDGKWPRETRIFEFVPDEILKEIWQKYAGSSDWSALVKEFLGSNCQQIGQTIAGKKIKGMSLSSDGNLIAVAQCLKEQQNTREHKITVQDRNIVQVFRYNSGQGQWIQVGQELYGNAHGHIIGEEISLNAEGNIMAFSEHGDNNHYVQVYFFNGQQWNKISNISIECHFQSLSLSSNGKTIAVDNEKKGCGYF